MEKTVPCIIDGSGISHHSYDGVCFITQFTNSSVHTPLIFSSPSCPTFQISNLFFPFSLSPLTLVTQDTSDCFLPIKILFDFKIEIGTQGAMQILFPVLDSF